MIAIRTLPEPPLRRRPQNFAALADNFVDQLHGFSLDCNAAASVIETAVTVVSSGLSATLWVSGATYTLNQRAFSRIDYQMYVRIVPGAGATDPKDDATNWRHSFLPEYPIFLVSGTSQTLAPAGEWVMRNASASEATLPASPGVGDSLRLIYRNGRRDNWLRRNGSLLMGKAEDMLINIPEWARRIRFYGGDDGWVVTR